MKTPRFLVASCALFALVSPLFASPGEPEAGGLEAGLDSIRAENISADLHFMASDQMRGRDTPSPEQRVAARYIRARLQRLGLKPGAENGYFHTYELSQIQLDEEASSVTFTHGEGSGTLEFGEDYFFYSTRSLVTDHVEGGLVFCGTGDKDEVRELNLEGKWALCFQSEQSPPRVRKNVQRRGAIGVLLMPKPSDGSDPYPEKYQKVVDMSRKGKVSYPRKDTAGKESAKPFPQLFLSRAAGLRLLDASSQRGAAAPSEWVPKPGTDLGVGLSENRVAGGRVELENVCGFWPGSDPKLMDEVILVSAHYDHVGAKGDEIWNGADDNGSGTTGLLALAEALVHYGPMRRSVMLLWVSGEEKGLLGSRAWTEDPWLPGDAKPICNLNIDMIGRNAPDYLLITPTKEREEYSALTKMAERNGPLEGFPVLGDADDYWHRSDHANFAKNLGIPVAFLFTDVHEDYHQTTDTPDKIDYDKIRRVTRLVLRMLDGLQGDRVEF